MTYQTINPYTNHVVATFPDATKEEVDAAITAAHDAFLVWRDTPFATRTAVLAKAADLLRAERRRYAEILTLEMGKVIGEAEAEVDLSADICSTTPTAAGNCSKPRRFRWPLRPRAKSKS